MKPNCRSKSPKQPKQAQESTQRKFFIGYVIKNQPPSNNSTDSGADCILEGSFQQVFKQKICKHLHQVTVALFPSQGSGIGNFPRKISCSGLPNCGRGTCPPYMSQLGCQWCQLPGEVWEVLGTLSWLHPTFQDGSLIQNGFSLAPSYSHNESDIYSWSFHQHWVFPLWATP